MNERVRSARRIVAVREQMARLAEWRLAASEASLRATETAQGALDEFLAEPHPGAPLGGLARAQARRLAARAATVSASCDNRRAERLDAEQRLRSATKVAEALAQVERDTAERHDLERLIEAATQRLTNGGAEGA